MIISDLSHFEEVASEAPSIVGGGTKTSTTITTADKLLSSYFLKQLSPELRAILKKTKIRVTSVTSKYKGAFASATVGSSSTGQLAVQVSISSSSASA